MTDVVSAARNARECLAQGLNALQSPGVPDHLIAAAEPIAKAMSCLHRIEVSGGKDVQAAAPAALEAARSALSLLQSAPIMHPAVNAALEAVAGSLGVVHRLTQATGSFRPPTAPAPAPVYASPVAPAPLFAPMQAPAPQPPAFAATTVASVGVGPMKGPSNAMADTKQSAGVAPVGPVSSFTPNSTMPSQGNTALAAASAPPQVVFGMAPTQPEAGAIQPSSGAFVEAALGAHSPTNFYKGLSGNDVVDAGGIFIATYQIPPIGTNLTLRVALPGGYEFQAQGVVRWVQETAATSDGTSPGFGAQFTAISQEGRQLVYRYVRNREPLFHDDF